MWYMYILSWIAMIIQAAAITLSIGAGLFYLAEIVEEYAHTAKKVINYTIFIISILAIGLLIFEEMSLKLIAICLLCNLLYYLSMRSFPVVDVYSPTFILSFVLFILHNYWAFDFFANNYGYYLFNQVICYMTIFCWLIPIALLISVNANDNVLPTYQPLGAQGGLSSNSSSSASSEDVVSNYFKNKNKKVGLLTFLRYLQENYLPQLQRKKY